MRIQRQIYTSASKKKTRDSRVITSFRSPLLLLRHILEGGAIT